MRPTSLFMFCLLFISFGALAQRNPHLATPAEQRQTAFALRGDLEANSWAANIPFRNVGPSIMSGRVTDLAVNPTDPSHFYVAYASGGLWVTENNGTTFSPIFDNQAVMTLGDIAVNWTTEDTIIWAGTGENNSSRSSYSGNGIYKSMDAGKTWTHLGLGESHHIGRIVLHPSDPNTAWVAALGHLYSPNKERGIYKTTDGGKTWQQTLFVNENTGMIDLIMDKSSPAILYASSWDRKRRYWNFWEAGAGSGIYKSTDGGENWTLLSTEKSGFPTGEGVGRIGLDIFKEGEKTVLYALLDNQNRREKEEKDGGEETGLTKDEVRAMSKSTFLKLEKSAVTSFLEKNRFPEKYSTDKIIGMVQNNEILPIALVEYLEDANSLLFDTPVIGAEVYRSEDGGKTWQKTHEGYLDDVCYSYGYYFGEIRVSPQNVDKVYIMGVPILKSADGGKTFTSISADNVHADHHALWLNPKRAGHLINGNDGGINISYDDGENWTKCNQPAVGQFYTVAVDMASPYNIYGGLQDNGVWVGSKNYEESPRWHQSGHYPYESILGGDGMQIAIDSRDNNTVYTGYQFGNYFRIDKAEEDYERIGPKHNLGDRPYRFNWQTPIQLSTHNQDILYMGSNKLHRSMNQGDSFTAISGDLTNGGKKGDVASGTLTSISESTLKFGLIYTGSDDGAVHITQDGGITWRKITNGLPQNLWVSRIIASSHNESTVYLSLNGYRWDDFTSYVYASNNYGQTWQRVGTNLPAEPVNVIKEDPQNPNLLYVGTDHGMYVSLDKGKTFMGMNSGLAAAPVHDLVIHPRDKELVIGTHGRSIYIANVAHLQMLHDTILAKPAHLFVLNDVNHSDRWGKSWSKWRETNTPDLEIPIFVKTASDAKIEILTGNDLVLQSFELPCNKGINYLTYDLTFAEANKTAYEAFLNEEMKDGEQAIKLKKSDNEAYYLQIGQYKMVIDVNGVSVEGTFEVKGR